MGKRIIAFLFCAFLLFCIGCGRQLNRKDQQCNNTNRLTYRMRGTNNVELTLQDGREVEIRFGKKSVKVKDAYLYDDESIFEIIHFIRKYASEQGLEIERGNSELYGEYRLHTILYSMEYKPSQTKDVDLDYIEDERWYVNVCSKIIGWCGI